MSKNYEVLRYIKKQVSQYRNDENLYNILARCFQNIEDNRESDGCLSNSVALYICLKEHGYEPKLCYGLCSVKDGFPFYHAWVEQEGLVIDIAIYGNINFTPIFTYDQKVKYPIVLEAYEICYVDYQKFCFDNEWPLAMISYAENKKLSSYIEQAPSGGMYRLISRLMGEPTKDKARQMAKQHGDIRLYDFRKNFEGGAD